MSESKVPIQAAPLLGQHTDELMAEDLGMKQADIDALREEGVIGKEMLDRGVAPI